jgi:sigma-B regulation protein RsbU (phosphoserine phosphatase)
MSRDKANTPTADILIVDDKPANLRLLSQMLVENGYQVRPAPDGSVALAAARAQPPDLILLDIRMPDMDGYQVCKHLKADASTRDIPIIFISALTETQDKVKAFAVGGVDYVTKPLQFQEVLARVKTHLALRRLQTELQHANTRLEDANKKMEQELILAGEVQAGFLPRTLPDVRGWQFSVTLKSARETSGDFYDINLLPDGHLGILVADVVDKGVGAALFMALSWTLIRTYAAEYPAHPEMVLTAVNRRILEDTNANQFVAVSYCILDPATGRLVYCNAGNCPPFVFRSRDVHEVHKLVHTGIPLGLLEDRTWDQAVVQLGAGDVLALYTDGITEAQNEKEEFYGEARLLNSIRANLDGSAREIKQGILADLQEFVGSAPQYDDITLAIIVRESAEN